jgi:hypothetical protein
MVPLATTRSAFEAQILAARLGSEGILWQLRGGTADSMYPVGTVDVLVAQDDLEKARELLEEGTGELGADDDADALATDHTEWWMAVVVLGLLALFIGLRIFSL